MLLDINAYIGHWPFKQLEDNTCEGLINRMNSFGVDYSVISNLEGIFFKNTQPANEELYRRLNSSRHFRDRLIPFAVINPTYAGWKNDLEICTDKMGMKGIRLYPKYHDYELLNPSLIELVNIASDRDLTVAFSLRMVDNRQRSWLDIKQEWALRDVMPIVKEVPDAKYLVLNVANSTLLNDEEAELFKKANILMDTSGRAISDLSGLINKYGRNKFAFGTHSPILDYLTGLIRIESLSESEANEGVKELLRYENAKRILQL